MTTSVVNTVERAYSEHVYLACPKSAEPYSSAFLGGTPMPAVDDRPVAELLVDASDFLRAARERNDFPAICVWEEAMDALLDRPECPRGVLDPELDARLRVGQRAGTQAA